VTPGLPVELVDALARLSEGVARKQLALRATAISRAYRSGGNSALIRDETDALAYALVRMPATYAAVMACFDALNLARPDFTPHAMIDVGAGPATAAFAAVQAFPSLQQLALADANDNLRALALALMRGDDRLRRSTYRLSGARPFLNGADDVDLVVASYAVGEFDEAERPALADLMWRRTRDTLVVVEPGTPVGYQRIIALRAQLIAQGAHVVAPCPHDHACPLAAPDWCHFAQRLPRTRTHKQIKGTDAPFEDEKFSYVVLSKAAPPRRAARILAEPVHSKAQISAKLCAPDGLTRTIVQRRDKAAYARARRWRWGDAID